MPGTKWDENRWSLEEADALGKLAVLRTSADVSARLVRSGYITYLLLAFYVAVIIITTTDKQLLKETAALLPLQNVELPLLGFYVFVPWLVFIFHSYLLLQFIFLSSKLHEFKLVISGVPEHVQHVQRELLFPFIFSLISVGSRHGRIFRLIYNMVVIFPVVIVPVTILLAIQWKFLPYHSRWIS